MEPDLDQRLSHPRGRSGRGAGARVHVRGRHCVCRRRARARARCRSVRAAAVLLLCRALDAPGGGREVPRRAAGLGIHHARPLRGEGTGFARAAVPHADDGVDAHRAAAAEQHRPHRDRGACRGARGNAVASHERVRRGARASYRGLCAHRSTDAADHRRGIRRGRDHRPARRRARDRGSD